MGLRQHPGPSRDAENADTSAFITVLAPVEVEFEIALTLKPRIAVYCGNRPIRFYIALQREKDMPNGRWLVSYFEPHWKPPVHSPA